MNNPKKIVVHNGFFHADDVFACYLILQLEEFSKAEIIRSNDPDVIKNGDIVIDVGETYNHGQKRYDHHQLFFNEKFPNSNVIMSSAGLIYFHYGKQIIKNFLTKNSQDIDLNELNSCIDLLWERLYFQFIQEIDAEDNEISLFSTDCQIFDINTRIFNRIQMMNPPLMEISRINPDYDSYFKKAISFIGEEFESLIHFFYNQVIYDQIIIKAIRNRFNTHPSGKIIELPVKTQSYQIVPLEKKEGIEREILFEIYYRPELNHWSIQVIDDVLFKARKSLPLDGKQNVKNIHFIHKTGFLGCGKTRESVIKLAEYAFNH